MTSSWARLAKFAQSNEFVRESIQVVEKALASYRLEETCVSFNGGKDCTALLHLLHSVLSSREQHTNNNNNNNVNHNNNNNNKDCNGKQLQISIFYSQLDDHFEEEAEFVQQMVRRYNLRLLSYSGSSLKESLAKLRLDSPQIKAIFVGSRRDDLKPGTKLDFMQPTDPNWPDFMRIHPILNWSYKEVWRFIRELEVPYCELYNQGYSSLGTKRNTVKNSSLLRLDGYYLPAWELANGQEERMSRSSSLDISPVAK